MDSANLFFRLGGGRYTEQVQHPELHIEGNLGQFEGQMVEREAGRSDVRGETVLLEDGQATTQSGAGNDLMG